MSARKFFSHPYPYLSVGPTPYTKNHLETKSSTSYLLYRTSNHLNNTDHPLINLNLNKKEPFLYVEEKPLSYREQYL